MREFTVNVKGKQRQPDYSQAISMFLDDIITEDNRYFKPNRKPTKKPFSPEDVHFATSSMQPSTGGKSFNCLYTVIVNRTI